MKEESFVIDLCKDLELVKLILCEEYTINELIDTTIETLKELDLKCQKQNSKKPLFIKRSFTKFYACPNCSNNEHYEKLFSPVKYCCNCGQKLDWAESLFDNCETVN